MVLVWTFPLLHSVTCYWWWNRGRIHWYTAVLFHANIKVDGNLLSKEIETSASVSKKEHIPWSHCVLLQHDPMLHLKLAADASAYGVGEVISNVVHNGEERLITFASQPSEYTVDWRLSECVRTKVCPQLCKSEAEALIRVKSMHGHCTCPLPRCRSNSNSATKLLRNLLTAFFTPQTLATSSALGSH